ncbi:hypothetical protein HMPREF1985_02203 [Mitsuokella sp. oral taxon 131 str. W9106]|nr:hypothetical protein HMPREF1985_02203 [Mitsuokella sp. oral taxon 131 str. W9106]
MGITMHKWKGHGQFFGKKHGLVLFCACFVPMKSPYECNLGNKAKR